MNKEKKYTVKELQDWAKIYGGKFLSNDYYGIDKKHNWCCERGHRFDMSVITLVQGGWCTICVEATRSDIVLEKMRDFAKKRGGKCLSEKYQNYTVPMDWECANGHKFKLRRDSLKHGTWCTICSSIERNAKRLSLMKNYAEKKGGKCLSEKYIDTERKLLWQCKYGHKWMSLPTTVYNSGHWCPECGGVRRHTIKDMQKIANEHGGKCLSDKYINTGTQLEWQCAAGHKWKTKPVGVIAGSWCPVCSGRVKHTLAFAKKTAIKRGGKCLSKEYINSLTPMEWECKNGHRWKSNLSSVLTGHWCRYCAGTARLTIEKMQEIAAERGGKCLSKEYQNNRTPLKWECNLGHKWVNNAFNILEGSWCPECSVRKRYDIKKLQEIAREKGGKCLSKEYKDNDKPLLWQCSKKHKWKSNLKNILKAKNFCPVCYKNQMKKNT